jgi:kumamolisin
MGVTVCVASGDNGSADMGQDWDGKPHADFPASSPFALACNFRVRRNERDRRPL